MLRTCNFELSPLDERNQTIEEVYLNLADLNNN